MEEFPKNRRNKDGVATYCKLCHNHKGRTNKEKNHGSERNFLLKYRYGIEAVSVEWMILQQGGVCALCGGGKPEHVDHDHTTGAVRGVVCFNCNRGISKFFEDVELMKRAIEYLDRARAA
jgi:hypothetical protein